MDSLYGGHAGISFVLRGRYDSVNAMVTAFKGGSNYNTIAYGEYVIIDTKNKNHIDNGKVYRRGYDYQNNMGGAEYIGQIVGPSSGTPYFQIDTLDDTKAKAQRVVDNDVTYKRYPTGKDENGRYQISENGDGADIATFEFNTNNTLVPGKTDEGTYNDTIKYTWVNIRDDTNAADSWFYVGFAIPYMVIDYNIHSVSPYDAEGQRADEATIERTDNRTHPFWEEWELGIPKGVKGDVLHNFRVMIPTARDTIYQLSALSTRLNPETGNYETVVGQPGYTGQQDDITNKRQILVLDYTMYDQTNEGKTITIYVGDYNLISGVKVDDEGTVTVEFTHDDDTVFTKKIRWIDNIELTTGNGVNGGHFTFTYNNDNPEQTKEFDISWIKGLEIYDDGSVEYTYVGTPDPEVLPADYSTPSEGVYRVEDFIQWIRSVTLNDRTGLFTVLNNRGETITRTQLDWINDVFIDEGSGEIALQHIFEDRNTGTAKNGQRAEILGNILKLIVKATVDSNGGITFYTNTGDEIILQGISEDGSEVDFKVKTLEDVRLETGIAADKHIQIKYNTENSYEPIGDPINFIQDIVVRASDWHLLVLYNDPTHRRTRDQLDEQNKDEHGNIWINNITGTDGTAYGASVYWQDFGPIKDQAGVLIGFNLKKETVDSSGLGDVISYLNSKYPNGLTGAEQEIGGASIAGKIVAYGADDADNKEFYAFDYSRYTWFYLGKFDESGLQDARLFNSGQGGADKTAIIQSLASKGLLFSSKEYSVADPGTKIPKFWAYDYNEWV